MVEPCLDFSQRSRSNNPPNLHLTATCVCGLPKLKSRQVTLVRVLVASREVKFRLRVMAMLAMVMMVMHLDSVQHSADAFAQL